MVITPPPEEEEEFYPLNYDSLIYYNQIIGQFAGEYTYSDHEPDSVLITVAYNEEKTAIRFIKEDGNSPLGFRLDELDLDTEDSSISFFYLGGLSYETTVYYDMITERLSFSDGSILPNHYRISFSGHKID